MHETQLILVGLLASVIALATLARVMSIPYPILLVCGGLVLGFVPGLGNIKMNPSLVLVIFLPPLLYSAAFFANLRDLRRDVRTISLLAVGLVLTTMAVVGVAAHAVIPGMPWAAALALGAIVAPTDAIAATAIAQRLNVPRRTVSILEGESLMNDATALVAYRLAVAAAVGSAVSVWEAGAKFVGAAAGGVALGLVVGWLVAEARKRIEDIPIEITISIFTGYAAYIPAERLGLSGVLAAVTAGLYVGWRAPQISTARMRLQGYSVWEILTFLVNATLFLLVGLQLHGVVNRLGSTSAEQLLAWAGLICALVIVTRIAWVFTVTWIIRALDRRPSQRERRAPARQRFIVAWAGMRGAVSLAAALALPLTTHSGAPFPQRDLIVFLTFSVILATLLLQGLTLPALIRRLGVHDDGSGDREELHARLAAAKAALARIDELEAEEWTRPDTIERMRGMYDYRKRRFAARAGKVEDDGYEDRAGAYQLMVRSVIEAERDAIVQLRNEGTISNDVMHIVERELDLEESRLEI